MIEAYETPLPDTHGTLWTLLRHGEWFGDERDLRDVIELARDTGEDLRVYRHTMTNGYSRDHSPS